MPKCFETWTVLPHEPIEKLAPNLWRVEGNLPSGATRRVMTVAKRGDGDLVIHNAIALEPELMSEIEAFGAPRVLCVPGGYHRLDAKVFKERYRDAQVVCPAGARARVSQVVTPDASYADAPSDDDVTLAHLPGTADREGVLTVRSGGAATLVFNDCINNLPKMSGLFGFLFAPTGVAAVPRLARWMMVKDRLALAGELERLADTPGLERIIVSHGRMIDRDAGAALRAVGERLRAS